MKFSVRTFEEGDIEKYVLVIKDKDVTLNINIQGENPSQQFRDLIEKVKIGLPGNIGCISLIPVGDYVVMTIIISGMSSRYISNITDLKFQ